MSISETHPEYNRGYLNDGRAGADPFVLFRTWLDEALHADYVVPTAMTLATAGPDGRPSARTVLLKEFDEGGFVFYTNYGSRKGRELAANPRAALLFFWGRLERQVQVEGTVRKIPRDQAEAYFHSRPRESQLGAVASDQSRVIESRGVLEEKFREAERRYRETEVPMPPDWGGYRLGPEVIEFWQGRAKRLHDRLRYTRRNDATWKVERLAP